MKGTRQEKRKEHEKGPGRRGAQNVHEKKSRKEMKRKGKENEKIYKKTNKLKGK